MSEKQMLDATAEKELLEKIAGEYTDPDPGRMVDRKFLALMVDRMLPWLKGPEILELGFGDDQWTGRIIERFGKSNIVDASDRLLEMARGKYGSRVTTFTSFFEEFAPEKKFDTIVASFVLEHVVDPVRVMKQAATWLAPGGHLLSIVPHADSSHRRLAVCMGIQKKTSDLGPTDAQMGHRRVYTIEHMEQDITEAGLQVARKRGMVFKPLPQAMMANLNDRQLDGFMKLGDEMPMEYAMCIAFDCTKRPTS
jgi:trans-aconitate methyltransferase